MNRRGFLKIGVAALAGLGPGGCAAAMGGRAAAVSPRPPRRALPELVPVNASWARVVRTTVGLRPHRDSGFVLKAQTLDAKTVIHDYGFGGAGMSLAWGTGAMAADMALQHTERRAAVLGCGSPGLTAARQLQRRGFDVTIYATAVPPNTTSNMSSASFSPTTALVNNDRRTPEWDAQFRQAVEIAFRQLQLLASPYYGISWVDQYTLSDNPPPAQPAVNDGGLLPDHLRTGRDREVLGPGEHPFPVKYAVRSSSMRIEPNIYLEALMRDFMIFGGKIVMRTFDTPRDLMSLTEPVIINCTGLGSRTLFSDEELVPIKGQITVLEPQLEVTYRASGRAPNVSGNAGNWSTGPRSDGIVLGSTMERGVWSLEPNDELRQQIVNNTISFFSAMHPRTRAQRTKE
jgi:glycine/D-amino acid oxidase-like deaminating enzyme